MQPIRLGVIGLGLIWQREHQPMLKTLSHVFEPVAFCDVSAERRAATARDYPGALVVEDYRALLERADVEAVLVLTPIAFNAPVAMAALRAGKDVIMEKPLARSVAEGQELVATARRAGRRLFVAEQLAYRAADERLAAAIASGEIGDLMLWNRIQHVDADPAQGALRYDTTAWRKHPDYPLGALFDGGIHLIASLGSVFGPPASLFATGRQLRPEYGEYDHVVTLFQYASGASGVLSHATALSPAQNLYHIHGSRGAIVVERNCLVIDRGDESPRRIELPNENPRVNLWQTMVHAWQAGAEPAYNLERALLDVAILEMVDRSIKSGQRMAVANKPDRVI